MYTTYLQRLYYIHKLTVTVIKTPIFVLYLVVLYCIGNIIGTYLYINRGVWGGAPSAGGENPAAGAEKFSTIAIKPPPSFREKNGEGGGVYSEYR